MSSSSSIANLQAVLGFGRTKVTVPVGSSWAGDRALHVDRTLRRYVHLDPEDRDDRRAGLGRNRYRRQCAAPSANFEPADLDAVAVVRGDEVRDADPERGRDPALVRTQLAIGEPSTGEHLPEPVPRAGEVEPRSSSSTGPG